MVAVHWTDERATGAIKERAAVLETPFRVAVIVAFWSVVKGPVVTVMVAEFAPAGIVTVAGAVTAPVVETAATTPPIPALLLREAVHVQLCCA